MSRRPLIWIASVVAVLAILVAGVVIYAKRKMGVVEPMVRQKVIEYLSTRFDAQVELAELHVRLPQANMFTALFRHNEGFLAEIDGSGLVMRYHGQAGLPPLFQIKHFRASIGFEGLLRPSRRVSGLEIDGMEINVPPREDRPKNNGPSKPGPVALALGEARIRNARLTILPKNPSREPLKFDIRSLDLDATGDAGVVNYRADLTNPKPPGDISSNGMFGPWEREDPGETPLSGAYVFNHADLSVFPAIAGILHSTGNFSGALSTITAKGEATVPDFRLKQANNPVPLRTTFEVLVDGTNGNTELRPVKAILGSTAFTTSGAVLKHEGETMRTIALQVNMKQGEVADLLKLAMKGDPILKGKIQLDASIRVPPIARKVKEKLIIDGSFVVSEGLFLKSQIRQQLDGLSRRAQGEPKNLQIEDVMTDLAGKMHVEDQSVSFSMLNFAVPGARVALTGDYSMKDGAIDFDGSASFDAKISQTITGWKRILVKPFDPLFARNGAGTFLPIEINGSSDHPTFSLSIKRAITGSTQ
jgi:hypothetical protein